ncbi:MAG: two-component system sensor histidine kinase NtrB [Janthinobacterium lividum]
MSTLALQSGYLGSWQLDVASQVAVRSLRHDQIFGYTEPAPEWTYEIFLGHVLPQDQAYVDRAYREALEAGQNWEFEARILRLDGEQRWIWAKGQQFKDESGAAVQIIGLVGDITERKQAELALRQSEKLAAIGRLASVIAHEINNPLESVTNLLYLARGSEIVEEIQGYLEIAESELQRVSAITAETLRFHRQSRDAGNTTWEDLLPSVLTIFHGRFLRHRIDVEQRHRSARTFRAFEGELRQVLTNLVGNAIDAMPNGGKLILRSRPGHNWRTNLPCVVLTVADTGKGMDTSTLYRIFQPFFSTKGAGGSGLGLWVSHEILQRHYGTLLVRSSPKSVSHGTVFMLFLPLGIEPERQRLQ